MEPSALGRSPWLSPPSCPLTKLLTPPSLPAWIRCCPALELCGSPAPASAPGGGPVGWLSPGRVWGGGEDQPEGLACRAPGAGSTGRSCCSSATPPTPRRVPRGWGGAVEPAGASGWTPGYGPLGHQAEP